VDFSAEWCTSCKTIEREVFGDPQVRQALAGVVLLRADITASDAAQRALMRRHQVMGPPTVMLFDAQGRERREQRLVGEFSARELLARRPAGEPS
jgi:thiol:disulfide interchange protein DsbD